MPLSLSGVVSTYPTVLSLASKQDESGEVKPPSSLIWLAAKSDIDKKSDSTHSTEQLRILSL